MLVWSKVMEKLKNKFKILINILTILGTVLILFMIYGIKEKIFTSSEALKLFLERVGGLDL